MSWTAESLYGVPGIGGGSTVLAPEPAAAAGPTTVVAGRPHLLANPTFWVVALLAIAFGFAHVSFRLS